MKQKVNRKLLRAILFALLLSVPAWLTSVTYANTGNIAISPAYPRADNDRSSGIFIHSLKAGESVKDGIIIQNNSADQITVSVGGVDSIASVGGSFACQQESEKQKKVGSWFNFPSNEVIVPAKSHKVVDFTLTVPQKTTPGEHNGCVVVRDKTNSSSKVSEGGGVQISYRSAIRFAVTIPGEIKKELSIESIKVSRIENGNYTISPLAHNTGNVSLDIKTRVQLVSNFNQRIPIQQAEYPVMPDSTMGWKFEFARPYWGGIL